MGGIFWGFGHLGKKYGVHAAPEGRHDVWATCTYAVYMSSTILIPLLKLCCVSGSSLLETLQDSKFRCLMAGTMACGITSGTGGLISTYAFSLSGTGGALISVIENGVYTV